MGWTSRNWNVASQQFNSQESKFKSRGASVLIAVCIYDIRYTPSPSRSMYSIRNLSLLSSYWYRAWREISVIASSLTASDVITSLFRPVFGRLIRNSYSLSLRAIRLCQVKYDHTLTTSQEKYLSQCRIKYSFKLQNPSSVYDFCVEMPEQCQSISLICITLRSDVEFCFLCLSNCQCVGDASYEPTHDFICSF